MPESRPLKILCVDDNQDFLNYILEVATAFDVFIDTAPTLNEALQKILSSYDAFIVDLNLPDGSGFEFVKEIRQQFAGVPIAVVSGVYRDEKNFRLLKEKYRVDYVLEKPIYRQQIESLFSELFEVVKKLSIKKETAPKEAKIEQLKKQYQQTIPDKIGELTKLSKAVQEHPTPETLKPLRDLSHKIGGSAGSYGYPEVSKICKTLQDDIEEKLKGQKAIEREWLLSLDQFLNEVKYNFQVPSRGKIEFLEKEFVETQRNAVYIIDNDLNFQRLIERKKGQYPLEISFETNPVEALKRLKSSDFNPRIVITVASFPEWGISGYEIIETMQKKSEFMHTIFGIFFEKEDLHQRIEASQKGIQHVFIKPVAPQAFLQTLSNELESAYLRRSKVLVLDDDIDICRFVTSTLNEIGIEVKCIEDPLDLYPTLEEFSPNVLLLDVFLPHYDGLNLLKTLRADLIYKNLIIDIITFKQDILIENQAYADNADDIFFKPIDKEVLQNRIVNQLKQQAFSQKAVFQKNILGLNQLDALSAKIKEFLISREESSLLLVLIEIDRFSDLVLQVGRPAANKTLIMLSNLLISKETLTRSCYSLEPEKFAILFSAPNHQNLQEKFDEFLLQMRSELSNELSFNFAMVPITHQFKSFYEIMSAAEETLTKARQKVPSKIKLAEYSPIEKVMRKKEIFLIDSDQEMLRILKTAFEAHDIQIRMFTSGKEAIEEISQLKENQLPDLIISERKLDDNVDGLEVFRMLKTRFAFPIPFFFLTIYSSDKDVHEGLRHGALEYITKPFNLSILIQKALNTLNTGHISRS